MADVTKMKGYCLDRRQLTVSQHATLRSREKKEKGHRTEQSEQGGDPRRTVARGHGKGGGHQKCHMIQEAWEDEVWRGQGTGMEGLIAHWTSEDTDVRIQVGHGGCSEQDPSPILWTLG